MKRLTTLLMLLLAMTIGSQQAFSQAVTIILNPGWTWISYSRADTLDFATALGTFTPMEGDIIKSQYGFAMYQEGHWSGGISHFYPGLGYMYRSMRTVPTPISFGEPAPQIIVTTTEPTDITTNSAICGGNVTSSDGNYVFVILRGICWSINPNPTFNDNYIEAGNGIGGFTASMTDLSIGTTYYVRAFAVTANGTFYGEQKTFSTRDDIPTLVTADVIDITRTSAFCGGNITNDGGWSITTRGVCWSTLPNPTIADSHTVDGSGTGNFISNITGLSPSTTYYVRAYASNVYDIVYGNEVSFVTIDVPMGAINGLFSISATQQVYFSQGNLQYQASTNTWRFAEHQYDRIGAYNANISPYYTGFIDLFGWGTSGYNHGAICYQPWSTSTNNSDYYNGNNLNDGTGIADWGYNSISNGGNQTNHWRTLTNDEWVYLFETRATESGIRYANARVDGIVGIVLLPDNWNSSVYELNNTNGINASYDNNIITTSDWSLMEQYGAVFLPACGFRNGNTCNSDYFGWYWSSSSCSTTSGPRTFSLFFGSGNCNTNYNSRNNGMSVRLVYSPTSSYLLPVVTTESISGITDNSAVGSGYVMSDGGLTVTERGLCWSTSNNPTVNDNHAISGTGTGAFTVEMTGLMANTTYYVRTYAINSAGMVYGNEVSFTTEDL